MAEELDQEARLAVMAELTELAGEDHPEARLAIASAAARLTKLELEHAAVAVFLAAPRDAVGPLAALIEAHDAADG